VKAPATYTYRRELLLTQSSLEGYWNVLEAQAVVAFIRHIWFPIIDIDKAEGAGDVALSEPKPMAEFEYGSGICSVLVGESTLCGGGIGHGAIDVEIG